MARFDGLTDFVKSGPRRLRDAEELIEPPTYSPLEAGASSRHLRGAMYLAGYGVECLLKAYLITRNDAQRLSSARDEINRRRLRKNQPPIKDICTAAGHDLNYLFELTDLEERLDNTRARQYKLCRTWRSDWRYDSSLASRGEAVEFVGAARAFADWLQSQL